MAEIGIFATSVKLPVDPLGARRCPFTKISVVRCRAPQKLGSTAPSGATFPYRTTRWLSFFSGVENGAAERPVEQDTCRIGAILRQRPTRDCQAVTVRKTRIFINGRMP